MYIIVIKLYIYTYRLDIMETLWWSPSTQSSTSRIWQDLASDAEVCCCGPLVLTMVTTAHRITVLSPVDTRYPPINQHMENMEKSTVCRSFPREKPWIFIAMTVYWDVLGSNWKEPVSMMFLTKVHRIQIWMLSDVNPKLCIVWQHTAEKYIIVHPLQQHWTL